VKVRIISPDGTSENTQILTEDGTDLIKIMSIQGISISAFDPMRATIDIVNVGLDVEAEAEFIISEDTEKWLNKLGYFKVEKNSG